MVGSPQGAVLVYEVDPKSVPDVKKVDMARLVAKIHSRLNSDQKPIARVKDLDGHRIEVALYSINAAAAQHVDELLQRAGTLEFRILANRRDDKALIEQALASPSKSHIHDDKGNLLAWWVPLKPGQEGVAGYAGIVVRRKNAAPQTNEVLVINDDYNVPGAYLTRADVGTDRQGRPCINFALNRYGGQLFGAMTESHLPDTLTDFAYRLGVILDGELYSAPSIQGTIYDHGEITGSFTTQEAQELVNVLNAGSLPARIRLVEKQQER
jgi:SecD/SecF fusion protein